MLRCLVFANENGGQTGGSYADNLPLRGRKGDIYEGGIRVPMAIMWKNHIPKGMISDETVTTLDLIPTFLAAANTKSTPTELDGMSLFAFDNKNILINKDRSHYWF